MFDVLSHCGVLFECMFGHRLKPARRDALSGHRVRVRRRPDGLLELLDLVDLPEGPFTIRVETKPGEAARSPRPSLFGKYPELAAISEKDIEAAKHLWQTGASTQMLKSARP